MPQPLSAFIKLLISDGDIHSISESHKQQTPIHPSRNLLSPLQSFLLQASVFLLLFSQLNPLPPAPSIIIHFTPEKLSTNVLHQPHPKAIRPCALPFMPICTHLSYAAPSLCSHITWFYSCHLTLINTPQSQGQ